MILLAFILLAIGGLLFAEVFRLSQRGLHGLRIRFPLLYNLRGLLQLNPEVKVLMASGYSVNEAAKEAIEAGAKGFVAKPYQVKEMLGVVREVLEGESKLESH